MCTDARVAPYSLVRRRPNSYDTSLPRVRSTSLPGGNRSRTAGRTDAATGILDLATNRLIFAALHNYRRRILMFPRTAETRGSLQR